MPLHKETWPVHPPPEFASPQARWLRDLGTLALLAVLGIPFYLLLNQYWQSLVLWTALYGALGIGFLRLGRYVRRVLRRTPADIPPWSGGIPHPAPLPWTDVPCGAADAIQGVYQDPYYLQDVLKPKLCQLLAYRLGGTPETALEVLPPTQCLRIDPTVLALLQRPGATGLWARYRERQQRVQNVLTILRHIETL